MSVCHSPAAAFTQRSRFAFPPAHAIRARNHAGERPRAAQNFCPTTLIAMHLLWQVDASSGSTHTLPPIYTVRPLQKRVSAITQSLTAAISASASSRPLLLESFRNYRPLSLRHLVAPSPSALSTCLTLAFIIHFRMLRHFSRTFLLPLHFIIIKSFECKVRLAAQRPAL